MTKTEALSTLSFHLNILKHITSNPLLTHISSNAVANNQDVANKQIDQVRVLYSETYQESQAHLLRLQIIQQCVTHGLDNTTEGKDPYQIIVEQFTSNAWHKKFPLDTLSLSLTAIMRNFDQIEKAKADMIHSVSQWFLVDILSIDEQIRATIEADIQKAADQKYLSAIELSFLIGSWKEDMQRVYQLARERTGLEEIGELVQ
ncbi:hypothetical protein [Xanthocytophaga agilis]|uniref:Uncharacterized protein n=1 Tax=Xanthocytophaga agilis TaxID=3048010 RepID=A0AAE3UFY3_9BACT|nr:hypothetical protein [Xanthocytophaga agilis]MDJ1501827.1 hypothetical protein [Xanthocytophaga agilis]